MLRLKNITKTYQAGNTEVNALKGINISFRKNEFVSILGPSGCGKTTTLNIIGGLDKYTDGDLFISGRSTKDFKDRDWDVYRNHRVGFIFQSYNLIPHQNVLSNVELALTIAGLSRKERVERAKKALDKVGLSGQYKKKPNQLSGGQCQRVAIARALVNDPEILLADEPTGALDTQTSIQIMELIKEIANERLVIMVTHNPDLAEKYSTRIIRLLDGEVQSDSNPFTEEEEIEESKKLLEEERNETKDEKKKKEKAKMSLFTAIRLSGQNLISKRKRTIMVAIAGSIGIIGVSMVLAISAGIKGYIKSMQDDMLSGYPLTIEESTYDMSSLMQNASASELVEAMEIQKGKVNINSLIEYLLKQKQQMSSMMVSNNITEDYINYVCDMPSSYYAAMVLDYDIDPMNNIYTTFSVDGETYETRSLSSILENYTAVMNDEENLSSLSSYISLFYNSMAQAPDNDDYILSQYDVLSGRIATEADEIMIVVSSKDELTDVVMGELGYYTQNEFLNIAYGAYLDDDGNPDSHYDSSLDKKRFSYEELMNKKFYYYPNDTVYSVESSKFVYNYKQDDTFENGVELKVVGILQPKESVSYGCLDSGFYYTEAFVNEFLKQGRESEIVQYLNDSKADSITSMNYNGYDIGVTYSFEYTNAEGETKTKTGYVGQSSNAYASIISSMMSGMSGGSGSGSGSGSSAYASMKTLSKNNLGGAEFASSVSIYPTNFNSKDLVTDYLDKWNGDETLTFNVTKNGTTTSKTLTADDREEIKYTDTIGLIISMINTMINIISYALIAFTALSLVVSTVMIGIITYVSVVERIKEIGVIRSLGGRKRDVSNLFIAETVMIGLSAGLVGIGLTYFISLIVNLILKPLVGFNICALPIVQALIMIGVSVLLTLISGVFPASSAAKKDPVVALRTE